MVEGVLVFLIYYLLIIVSSSLELMIGSVLK